MNTEKNAFECDQCNRQFEKHTSVKSHQKKVHKKAKYFPCDQCHKQFKQSGDLKRHIRTIHDKIKDFPCNHCGLQCASKNDLKIQVKITQNRQLKILAFNSSPYDFDHL